MKLDTNLLTALATILTPFLVYVLNSIVAWLRTKTKNGNLQLLLTWAAQAVALLEQSGLSGSDKKRHAIDYLATRLAANKLTGKFSQEQLSAVIEQAVAQLNKEGK